MKGRKIISVVILLLGFEITKLHAQEIANASGSNVSGSGGTVSYSVGQIVYTTNTGTNGSMTQGTQQPYEISEVTGTKDGSEISLSMAVYPNPATDFLILNVENYKIQNLSFELYDINGKVIKNKNIENSEIRISMEGKAAGIYFLKVIKSNKELRVFKIIKN